MFFSFPRRPLLPTPAVTLGFLHGDTCTQLPGRISHLVQTEPPRVPSTVPKYPISSGLPSLREIVVPICLPKRNFQGRCVTHGQHSPKIQNMDSRSLAGQYM